MLDTDIFICQLPVNKQLLINKEVLKYCNEEKFTESETEEIIQNVMSDRLCLLEEIGINTMGLLN